MITHNYPDTAFGIQDPQEVRPACRCEWCGGEIYPGQRCWRIGGPLSDYVMCDGCTFESVAEEES